MVDTDFNSQKNKQLEAARELARENNIKLITSSPTFEIWFLNHFKKTTGSFMNFKQLEKDLVEYIPNYKKTGDYYELLIGKIDVAIANSKFQCDIHLNNGKDINFTESNPSTLVHEVISLIKK